MESLIILLPTFAVFWLLFIRPQQRRVREHQALVASLQPGDAVISTAGIFGTVTSVDDDTVRLQVAPGTELRMARQAIARRILDDSGGEAV